MSSGRLEDLRVCMDTATTMSPLVVLRTILCANPTAEQVLVALAANGLKIVSVNAKNATTEESTLRALADDKATTAKRIAETRKAKGINQEKLAELLDCHTVTVSKLETGVMDLTMEWILRIADALGVHPTRFTEDQDIIHDPRAYVQGVLDRHQITPNGLATKVGLSGSTLSRAMNDPKHKFMLSTRTLQKIKEWDQAQ